MYDYNMEGWWLEREWRSSTEYDELISFTTVLVLGLGILKV